MHLHTFKRTWPSCNPQKKDTGNFTGAIATRPVGCGGRGGAGHLLLVASLGALLGAGLGALLGASLGALMGAGLGSLLGAGLGALMGAGLGALLPCQGLLPGRGPAQ